MCCHVAALWPRSQLPSVQCGGDVGEEGATIKLARGLMGPSVGKVFGLLSESHSQAEQSSTARALEAERSLGAQPTGRAQTSHV